jgi:predicted membrane channel-forming protein YqfA (hemolysin III family)
VLGSMDMNLMCMSFWYKNSAATMKDSDKQFNSISLLAILSLLASTYTIPFFITIYQQGGISKFNVDEKETKQKQT